MGVKQGNAPQPHRTIFGYILKNQKGSLVFTSSRNTGGEDRKRRRKTTVTRMTWKIESHRFVVVDDQLMKVIRRESRYTTRRSTKRMM